MPRPVPERFVLVASLLAGAGLPLAYYLGRQLGSNEVLWKPPPHSTAMLLWAAAVALAAVGAAALSARWRQANDHPVAFALGASAAAGAVVWQWQFAFVMGDGRWWLHRADQAYIMGSEPLGRWSHYLAYQVLSLFGVEDGETALRLASVLAGVFAFGAVLWLAPRALPRSDALLIALFLILAPAAFVLWGVTETTPWAYAFTAVYLLAGLAYLREGMRRPPWAESVLLMLAVWTHGMALFVTGAHAALVGLWFFSGADRGGQGGCFPPARVARASALCAIPFAALGGTLLFAYLFGTGREATAWYGSARGGADAALWVAFGEATTYTKGEGIRYGAFSFRHRRDLLNLVLLISPLLVLAPLVFYDLRQRLPREALFLGCGIGGLLLFSVFINPDLGMRGDLDLMAMFGTPMGVLALLWWDERLDRRGRWLVAGATATAAFACGLAPMLRFP